MKPLKELAAVAGLAALVAAGTVGCEKKEAIVPEGVYKCQIMVNQSLVEVTYSKDYYNKCVLYLPRVMGDKYSPIDVYDVGCDNKLSVQGGDYVIIYKTYIDRKLYCQELQDAGYAPFFANLLEQAQERILSGTALNLTEKRRREKAEENKKLFDSVFKQYQNQPETNKPETKHRDCEHTL